MNESEFEDDDEDFLHQFIDAPVYNFDLDEELMISDQQNKLGTFIHMMGILRVQ